jgi:PASTA domain
MSAPEPTEAPAAESAVPTTQSPIPASVNEAKPVDVSVPSVNGSSSAGAKRQIEQAGFVFAQSFDYSSDVAKGYVLSQNPPAGTRLARGATVTIVVSSGMPPKPQAEPSPATPEPTTLPPVITIVQRIPAPAPPTPSSSAGSAEQFIRGYYDLVNAERFEEAWQLLTPSYQNKVGSLSTYRSYFSSKRKIIVYGFGSCEFGGICNFHQRGSAKLFRLGITDNSSYPQINENYTR